MPVSTISSSSLLEELEENESELMLRLQSGSLDGAGWGGGGLRGGAWASVRGGGGVEEWGGTVDYSLVGGGRASGCEGATGE